MTMILLNIATNHHCLIYRTLWVKMRSGEWCDRIENGNFTEEEWVENFRIGKNTFVYLCNELRSEIRRYYFCQAVTVEKWVAMALWRLATNGDYRLISHLFGVAKGTVCVVVNEVCRAIVKVLFNKYVKLPTGPLLKETVLGFDSKFGFP